MSHVTSPVLRRLQDEPLAVPDAARRHLAACPRCQAANSQIAQNAALAALALATPAGLPGTDQAGTGQPGTDQAWARLQLRLAGAAAPAARRAVRAPRPRPRLAGLSLGTGTAAVAGVVAAGTGAAVALSTVYAPTHVAPVKVTQNDFRAISTIASVGGTQVTDGLPAAGHERLPFGDLTWTSAAKASPVASVAAARARTGLPLAVPATLPAGVGALREVVVQPRVTVTIRFDASAGGGVGGSTLVISGGPGAIIQYGSAAARADLTTLVIADMRRPVATSTGASTRQLEDFLLAQRDVPTGLAQELRVLGTTALPVPVPSGVAERHVSVGGSAGVLLADPSGAAAGVIWESPDGVVHGAGGLLSQEDVLNVARQLG
jgi:hypothetical protein